MNATTLILIAVGLSLDALAVSVLCGATVRNMPLTGALTVAASFGAFQAAMPVVGWLAGTRFMDTMKNADHWIAFALLAGVGGKMVFESFQLREERKRFDPLSPPTLLMLSVATSIDALAVGFSLSLLNVAIAMPAVLIGTVTFTFSLLGIQAGRRFGHFFENTLELAGGVVLIGIGLKILFDHLAAG